MSRSERYIEPSAEELERMRKARQASVQFKQDRVTLLRRALKRTRKADLVELTPQIAEEEQAGLWRLEKELSLDKPVDLLVHDIEAAIEVATKVDEQQLNYNFDYDWRAYEAIQWGFEQLVERHALAEAKSLALTLAKKGSHQMDSSDEGLMREDIESCLRVVISAASGSPDAAGWAWKMRINDSSGFLCEEELVSLAAPGHRGSRVRQAGSCWDWMW